MLACSLKELAIGAGRVEGGQMWCPFIQSVITQIRADIRLGDALLRSPQLERTFKRLYHV